MPRKVIIMGAAGRDFHNFNTYFRNNANYEVVCFTAAQIPNISGRSYPPELSGPRYPKGIPIYQEEKLPGLIKSHGIDEVVFAYSDVSHEYVMHRASTALANGASFTLLGPHDTMLKSTKPVISICAVRTGSGKSQTTRKIATILREMGKRAVILRHPMPYGDLRKEVVQRFASVEDMEKNECTIEEEEEYEQHIKNGAIVYAGVDYEKILRAAEEEADVILWDGGNNDFPFIKPDLSIVVADPRRAGHELIFHPGETNLMMADVVIINKVDSADAHEVEKVRDNIQAANNDAIIIEAASPVALDKKLHGGEKVLAVEDGPTITHGGLADGAAAVAAKNAGCELVDPKPYAVGSIKKAFEEYPHIRNVLPALGYGKKQIEELEQTINKVACDAVIVGTPIDLRRLIKTNKPMIRAFYDLREIGKPDLRDIVKGLLSRR